MTEPGAQNENRLDEDDESQPILLSRLSISRIPPAPGPSAREITGRPAARAAPPLAAVDWKSPGAIARRLGRLGLVIAAVLALVALFADLAASDLPLLCRMHGSLYVLPCVTRPPELAGATPGPGDWAIRTLVAHGPRLAAGENERPFLGPSLAAGHPLGTDREGRDVFARTIHGTRSYLVFALLATLASLAVGAALGALAGIFGGALDAFVSRAIESVSAFPPLVLVLGVQAAVPRPTLFTLFLAIAVTRWPEIARLVRGEVLLATTRDYVLAARALGAPPLRVLRRHIMPNVRTQLVVAAAIGIGAVVLTEASLDFLRIGAAGAASWGETLSEFRDAPTAWWLLAFPGGLLVLTVVAYNLMGEALREVLDPRSR